MKTRINIPAFTLLESLITLMLISITIALTYSLINLVEKQLIVLEQENNQVLDYNLFNSALISDIDGSVDSLLENDSTKLTLNYYNETSITYNIKTNEVLRQTIGNTDTFKIKTISHNLFKPYKTETTLQLRLILLKDTINTNYILKTDDASLINKKLFNED